MPHLLQRSWTILPNNDVYRFDNICLWVNTLYEKDISLNHANLRQAVLDDAVFGSKPQERYSEHGEEDSGQVILRAKEYETFDVVPQMFEGDLTESSEMNRNFLVKINEFKFWKAYTQGLIERVEKSILVYRRRSDQSEYQERKYFVLKRPYTFDYGIDFTGDLDFPTDDQPIKIPSNVIS